MRECFGHGLMGKEFPESDFEFVGNQYVHVKSQPPLHNSAGELLYLDAQGRYRLKDAEAAEFAF